MKDKKSMESLSANLQGVLQLDPEAVEWLLMVYHAIQVFDDVADGDPIERDDLDMAIWNTLVSMYQNKFFVLNNRHLTPLVSNMILKWQASDRAERGGQADAKSFVWRAGYYDLVLGVVQLCHGAECAMQNAHHVMALYGEKLEDYLQEFSHA